MIDRAGRTAARDRVLIDGWAHCGIRRFHPIEDVIAFLDAVGIDRAVLIQPLADDDNDYLLGVTAAHHDRVRCVAVVSAADPQRAVAMRRLADEGASGVRVTTAELVADPDFAVDAAMAGLVTAIHAPDGVAALEPLIGLLGSLGRPVIIPHLGMPTVVDGTLQRGAEILSLAEMPNLHVTISGLAMATPYPYDPLVPLIGDVVAAFGPDRVLWGSNYPLVEAADTLRDLDLVESTAFGLDDGAIRAITDATAERLWFG